ncbi:MAG: shikimate kinase [Bacteriovoracia bacterium]
MKKIAVIGVSCSGKTTFGKLLSKKLGLQFIDLDDLFWNPGWVQTGSEVFLKKVQDSLQTDGWIIVGNYKSVQDTILEEADTVIWLDYSASVVWRRAIYRTIKRALFKEPCCNGNVESFRLSFFSKDSILLWVYKDFSRKKKRYEEMLATGKFDNKKFIRPLTPKDAALLLK